MRDFRLFQGGVFTSIMVYNMLSVANGWYVYDQTHNPLDLGLVGLAQFVPAFLMTFVSGQLADRFDRRRLIIIANTVMMLCSLLLWLLTRQSFSRLAFLTVIGLVAMARALEAPSTSSFLPELVSKNLFSRAVAWHSSVKQMAKIVGPALGGLLYGIFKQADAVFLVCGAGSLIAALTISAIQTAPFGPHNIISISWASFKEGISYVMSKPLILGAVSMYMCAVLLGGAVALLPVYAKDILHIGPMGLGWLRSAPAFGAVAMAFILGRRPLQHHMGQRLTASVFVFGLLTILFGLSTNFWLSLVVLFFLGAADNVSVVLRHSLVQLATPQALRGRVSAVNQAFIVTSNQLGEFESGATAALMGTVPAVVAGGIGTCLIAMLWPRIFPALRKFGNFDSLNEPG